MLGQAPSTSDLGASPNYFTASATASRYSQRRPFLHPTVRVLLEDRLAGVLPVRRAVDVGCGTGNSTRILAGLAEEVIGVDPSTEMLAQALEIPGTRYLVGSADAIPVESSSVDLLTLSMVFHWLEPAAFLQEAARVLCSGGWMAVYKFGSGEEMACVPGYTTWHADEYLTRFPHPPRLNAGIETCDLASHGLALRAAIPLETFWPFTPEELAGFLSTQSNVIAQVEAGSTSLQESVELIRAGISPLFRMPREVVRFRGELHLIQRSPTP